MILLAVAGPLFCGPTILTMVVEREADYSLQSLGGEGVPRALILYHPSRDAHFTDELSLAVAEGSKAAGYSVDLATLTCMTPISPRVIACWLSSATRIFGRRTYRPCAI